MCVGSTPQADDTWGYFVRSHWFALHGLLGLASRAARGATFLSDPNGEDFLEFLRYIARERFVHIPPNGKRKIIFQEGPFKGDIG